MANVTDPMAMIISRTEYAFRIYLVNSVHQYQSLMLIRLGNMVGRRSPFVDQDAYADRIGMARGLEMDAFFHLLHRCCIGQ